jgi:excinuclease ABC subunit C
VLEEQMKKASSELDFEKAAELRDKIHSIKAIGERQKIINSDKQTDMDIIAFAARGNKAFAAVFFVRSGSIIGRESYPVDNIEGLTQSEIITAFAEQFYSAAPFIPPTVMAQYDFTDSGLISSWLSEKRGGKVEIAVPKIGEKKYLMDMVVKNALAALDNYELNRLKQQERSTVLSMLAESLGLEKEPERIESYDMSHISGSDNVAAMVVFQNGKPKPSLYRRFRIKQSAADDYAAMQEVLYRRFRRALDEQEKIDRGEIGIKQAAFLPLPDIILLDGGKGQLSSAAEIMEQMDIDIPLFGMVKNSKHKTRGLLTVDGREIEMSPVGGVFKFITRIQDEVHKTAIEYHRKLRSEGTSMSELDKIKGVGAKRKTALLQRFKTIDNIKKASLDELKETDGVDVRTAQSVYEYFRQYGV